MRKLSRMQIIRKYCVWCFNNQPKLVKDCSVEDCVFYSRRGSREDKSIRVENRLTAKQATRARCLACSNNSYDEIRHCTITDCILWPWRMGKNPYRKQH